MQNFAQRTLWPQEQVDIKNQYRTQIQEANKEIMQFHQSLHNAQESQVSCEEQLGVLRTEHNCSCGVNSELEKEIDKPNAEIICVNQEHDSHLEHVRMELELQYYHKLEEQQKSWDLRELQLCELVRFPGDIGDGHQLESSSYSDPSMSSLSSQPAVISSHLEVGTFNSVNSTEGNCQQ